MGRSQVAYNRRHGRPGAGGSGGRGRGRGGRGAAAASGRTKNAPSRSDLGSNAWRYERKRDESGDDDNEAEDDGEWDDAGATQRQHYGEHGAAAHDVASTSAVMGEDKTFDYGGGGRVNVIDLAALSKSLSRLPVRERLRLPPHVAERWEERYGRGGGGGAAAVKKTVSELRVTDPMDVDPAGGGDPPSVEERNEDRGEGTVGSAGEGESKAEVGSTQEDGVSDGDVDGEEEDLDAWLDSVI